MAIVSLTTRAVSRAIGADEKKKLAKALQGIDRRVFDLTMAALDRPSDDDEVEVIVTLTKGRQTAVVTTGLVVQRRFFDSKTGKIKKINHAAHADRWVNAVLGSVRAAVLYLADESQLDHMKIAQIRDFAIDYIGGELMPPEPMPCIAPEAERANWATVARLERLAEAASRVDENGECSTPLKTPPRRSKMKAAERKAHALLPAIYNYAYLREGNTRACYLHTYDRVLSFAGSEASSLIFEDVTRSWLENFEKFLSRTSPSKNARNIHFRNIRAVFNLAIDDGITTHYPFRTFKIRPVKTAKRSMTVEALRTFINADVDEWQREYRDLFVLSFFLIGINPKDLMELSEIVDGRIEFNRSKTRRFYSIKVEPEALEIITRYAGTRHLIDPLDRYVKYKDYLSRWNKALKTIGTHYDVGLRGARTYHPIFPTLSCYWARHTWATIAASLDIPKETIAHGLGHGNETVTDIYIDFNMEKVDEANRRVIDWVLYGKR